MAKHQRAPIEAPTNLPDEPSVDASPDVPDAPPDVAAPASNKVRIVAVHGDFYHQLTGQKFTQTEETEADLDSFLQVQIDAGKLRVASD